MDALRRWELSEQETTALLRAGWRCELQHMWNVMEITKRAKMCGLPLGLDAPFRWHGDGSRILDGCSTCADAACAGCGREEAVRRWAMSTLAIADHEANRGQCVMLSLAGQHDLGEPIEQTAGRLKEMLRVICAQPLRDVRRQLGVVGMIRRIEPTFGGRNGCHPNAHVVFLLEGAEDDLDERAARFRQAIVSAMVEWGCGRQVNKATGPWFELWRRF